MLRELLEEGSIIELVATFIALSLIVASILCLVFIIIGVISGLLIVCISLLGGRKLHWIGWRTFLLIALCASPTLLGLPKADISP